MPTVSERREVLVIPPASSWDAGRAAERALVRHANPDAALMPSRMAVVSVPYSHIEPGRSALGAAALSAVSVIVREGEIVRPVVYSVRIAQVCLSIMPNQARAAEAYRRVATLGRSAHLLDCSA